MATATPARTARKPKPAGKKTAAKKADAPKSRMTQAEKLQHARDIEDATLRAGKDGYRQGKEDALRIDMPPKPPAIRAAEVGGQGTGGKEGLVDRALALVQTATRRIQEVATITKQHTDGVVGADAPDSPPSPSLNDARTRGPRGVELMNALDVLHAACSMAEQEAYRLSSI